MSAAVHSQPATCLVTVAGSAGAFRCVSQLLGDLRQPLNAALAVLLHSGPGSALASALAIRAPFMVREAQAGVLIENGYAYVAAPGTHLIINPDARVAVSAAQARRPFRPSADWLLESAAATFGDRHIAVILSGLLSDGSQALRAVKRAGGMVIVQDPGEAAYSGMPDAAIATGVVDLVVSATGLADAIHRLLAARDLLRDAHVRDQPFDVSAA